MLWATSCRTIHFRGDGELSMSIKSIGKVLLLFLTLTGIVCGIELATLVHDLDRSVRTTSTNVQTLLDNAAKIEVGATATLAEVTSASREQRVYWQKTAQETSKTVRAVRQLIDRTDRSLNDSLIPQLQLNASTVSDQTRSTLASLEDESLALQDATKALNTQVSNPDVASSLSNLASSSAELKSSMANVSHATADLAAAIHRETRPASWTVKTIGFAIDKLSSLSGLILGLVK